MSNLMKMQSFLFSSSLNHFITLVEFFHWLTFRCCSSILLIFSSFCLLTFPSSVLEGLIRRHGSFELKFSLWSLSVMKAGFLARCSILSLSSSFLDIYAIYIYIYIYIYIAYIYIAWIIMQKINTPRSVSNA